MLKAFLLGIIQGLTEFLPISSSGHLVLAQMILPGFKSPGAVFEVVLHAGSLLAAVIYFKNDLIWLFKGVTGKNIDQGNRDARSWVAGILIATVPIGIAGLAAKNWIESLFDNPRVVSAALIFTGMILFAAEWFQKNRKPENLESVGLMTALWVGLAQTVALIPGVSRSGTTMAAGFASGWNRVKAARFSFLLMLPAVAGAVVLESTDIHKAIVAGDIDMMAVVIGFIASLASSYVAIWFLMKIIQKHSFIPFAVYCLVVGTLSIALQMILC